MNKKRYSYSDLIQLFENAIIKAESFKDIPEDLLALKPDSSSWSTGEIFRHLVKFNNIYLGYINRAIKNTANPKPVTDEGSFQPRLIFRGLIGFVKPPYKIKMSTIAPMYPVDVDGQNFHSELDLLIKTNEQMIGRIRNAGDEKLNLNKIKGKNPVFKISMTLSEFILMFDAHQQRHFWQADQTLKRLKVNPVQRSA